MKNSQRYTVSNKNFLNPIIMYKILQNIVIPLIFCALLSCEARSATQKNRENSKKDASNYDYLVLSVTWSASYVSSHCNSHNNKSMTTNTICSPCNRPHMKNNWTIHGLWPSNFDGSYVSECSDIKYEKDSIDSDVRTQMLKKWPSAVNSEQFWSHEWKKHGTCFSSNLNEFFLKTVELFDEYDVEKALEQAGLGLGGRYRADDFYRAIKGYFGKEAEVTCRHEPKYQDNFITEIWLCFNNSFELIDCKETRHACKRNTMLSFPKYC